MNNIKDDILINDVKLIEEIESMIMGGGYSNKVAWEIIKLVRKHDSELG